MKKIIGIVMVLASITVSGQSIPKWKIGELEEYISRSRNPLIVNFWATYCGPCLEEIPYFEELTKKYKSEGVELILVSIDFEESYPKKIQKFVAKQKYSSSIVWLDETNADFFCPRIDSSWSGVMPATLFVNNTTGFRSFYEEQISKDNLEKEIRKMISQ